MINLNDYAKIIETSQKGEDGMLQKLFQELEISSGYFCEFGAGDGVSNCNTSFLCKGGWKGLYIEMNKDLFKSLQGLHKKNKKISLINDKVSLEEGETLDFYLEESKAPKDFDLLSIDIDGNDLWVWESLKKYTPKVVITEYNSQYPSSSSVTVPYNKDHSFNFDDFYGASAGAFDKLAKSKGYSLVGYTAGLNLIFLKDELNDSKFKTHDVSSIPLNIGWKRSVNKLVEY
jgi:hypothetical protein